ncbi:hypothetical protein [Nocardia wallacei]|uniref:hypothetical protein n=1 Tax=Nocardia wallacei TaxID=480035 RepID=UPI0024570784|nr:hypothetical protein [Nocardia wallacei]
MLRYSCSNPWCPEGWHYLPGRCPWWPQTQRTSEPMVRRRPLTAEQRAGAQRYLERRREAEIRAEAEAAERARKVVWIPGPHDDPPAPRDPGHGWLLVFLPVAVLVGLALLAVVLYA